MKLSLTGVFLSAVNAVVPEKCRTALEDFCTDRRTDARLSGGKGSRMYRFWDRAAQSLHRQEDDWEVREQNIRKAALRVISVAGGADDTGALQTALKEETHLDALLFRANGDNFENPAFLPVSNSEVIDYIKRNKEKLLDDPYLNHIRNRQGVITSPQNAL